MKDEYLEGIMKREPKLAAKAEGTNPCTDAIREAIRADREMWAKEFQRRADEGPVIYREGFRHAARMIREAPLP